MPSVTAGLPAAARTSRSNIRTLMALAEATAAPSAPRAKKP